MPKRFKPLVWQYQYKNYGEWQTDLEGPEEAVKAHFRANLLKPGERRIVNPAGVVAAHIKFGAFEVEYG